MDICLHLLHWILRRNAQFESYPFLLSFSLYSEHTLRAKIQRRWKSQHREEKKHVYVVEASGLKNRIFPIRFWLFLISPNSSSSSMHVFWPCSFSFVDGSVQFQYLSLWNGSKRRRGAHFCSEIYVPEGEGPPCKFRRRN